VRDLLASGHAPDEARQLAERRLGNLARVRAACIAERTRWEHAKARRWMWAQLGQDVRFAWRTLRRTPTATAIAAITTALAIGAITTIFSVVHGVLIKPLPYPAADRLMEVRLNVTFQSEPVSMSMADFLAWRDTHRSFDQIAAYSISSVNVTGAGTPEAVIGGSASDRLFDLLGARAALGRTFLPGDDRAQAEPLVVLSDGFWKRHFGADPGVIGRSISITGVPSTIVGVLPPGFAFPQANVDLWRNLRFNPQRRGPFFLTGIGRLRAGTTVEQAREELRSASAQVRRQYAGPDDWSFAVRPLHEVMVGRVRQVLWLFFGAVVLLLLIAVVNVANLLLARATAREHEMGLRTALGAGRWRLVRQLLTESVLLAALGGAVGVGLAFGGTRFVVAMAGDRLPRSTEIAVDLRVLAFSALIALGAGLLFGLAPALQTFRSDVIGALKAGRRSVAVGRARPQAALVVVQVALATVLMICASLLTRSVLQLLRHDPGFRSDRLLTFYLDLPFARYQSNAQVKTFYDRLATELQAIPGVESVGMSASLPPDLLTVSDAFVIDGQPVPAGQTPPVAPWVIVNEDYFKTLGIRLLRGRVFDRRDHTDAEPVMIVSRTLARQHFGSTDPLGRRMRIGPPRDDWPWVTIIGIVGDVPYTGLDAEPQPAYYVPLSQENFGDYYVVLRTGGDPASFAPAARAAVWSVDREQPVGKMLTMEERLREAMGPQTFRATLVGLVGSLGFVLAGIGIYGVLAYAVSQRTQELGIRTALGARPSELLRLVISTGVKLTSFGIVTGVAAAVLATRALSGLLFGIGPHDPAAFLVVIVLTLTLALVASLTPAWRAMRVDPISVLRQE
jgi:putative ABC transport system permease protein